MDLVWEGLREAFWLLVNNDNDVYEIAQRSLYVSGTATLIALVLGVAIGATLAFRQFRGRLIALALVNTGMGLPPVVIGLFIALMLWRSGPLGDLGWIYSTKAMVIAQVVIATPVITGFTAASLAALMAGFGAAISEVGASVMVGGNIDGDTRVLTGAVLLEQSKGNFGTALALGIILLGMMVAVNVLFTWVQLGRRCDAQIVAGDSAPIDATATAYRWTSRS